MIYRNAITGAEINTPCTVSGDNWVKAASAAMPTENIKDIAEEKKTGTVKGNGSKVRGHK